MGFVEFRNKMGRKKIPKSSNEVFHKIFQLLQRLRILLKDQDERFVENKVSRMKKWLRDFWKLTDDLEVEGVW
jgi:hypothetical protein